MEGSEMVSSSEGSSEDEDFLIPAVRDNGRERRRG